ncbi:MAG: DUF3040 domain-containing protein [Nocardioides sp.]
MGLSAEELRLLEQMERALVEEDPKFASTLRGTSLRSIARRRAIIAGVAFVVGVAVMMTGVVAPMIPVGIVGFLIMLASATIGLTALRGQRASGPTSASASDEGNLTLLQGGRRERRSRQQRQRSQGSFMERMEERWRRRRDGGGGFH